MDLEIPYRENMMLSGSFNTQVLSHGSVSFAFVAT